MVASSETTVAVRLRVIGVPVPSAPAVSRKYSASVMVPPAPRSSPVAETATSWLPLAGTSARLPLVVCGPVLGRFRIAEPTTPQFPAASSARTKTVCLPASSASRTAVVIVPVALATSTVPKVPVIGVPKPGPVVTASSTTSSAWLTVDPPVVASLRSAVTVTGALASEGLGDRVTCVDTGPTPSVLGGGAAVSRKVSMPPKANDSGSAVDCPLLSRWPAASYSATLASGPEGIEVMVSAVAPGSTASVTADSA